MGWSVRSLWVILVVLIGTQTAQAAYHLKAGDVLDVNVWQEPKLNRQVVIGPDGQISFPLVGHLLAGGRTVEDVESSLLAKLKVQYKTELDVTVALVAVKEIPIKPDAPPPPPPPPPPDPAFYVTGEVAKPGQYSFNRPTNLLQGLAVAGGLGPFAAGHRILLRRMVDGREQLYQFDYLSFISGEDLNGNLRLHHGDVIIVPEKRLFE